MSLQNKDRYCGWLLALALGAVLLGPFLNLTQYWNHNPLYGYAWFVPMLTVLLVYLRLDWLGPAKPVSNRMLPVGIVLLGVFWIPLRVVQVANPDWRIIDQLYLGSAVLSCLLLIAWLYGWQWTRVLFFPLVFLLTTLPWPLRLENIVTLQSLQGVGETARVILAAMDYHVLVVGFEVRSPYGIAHLSEACSGIRSFHLALVGGLFLGAFFNLSITRRVILFLACLLTAYLVNVLRVVLLVRILFEEQSVDAMNAWHDRMGWIMQFVFFVLMIFEALLLLWVWRNRQEPVTRKCGIAQAYFASASPRLPLIVAVLLLALAPTFLAEGWYAWRESRSMTLNSIENWALSHELPRPGMRELEMPLMIREQLPYEEGRYWVWTDPNGMVWQLIWMRFNGSTYSAFAHNIHQPETCLPSQNYTLQQIYDPVSVTFGDETYDWQYQVYEREGMNLNLFFNKTASAPVQLLSDDIDFSPLGRLRLAWKGVRIHEAQVLHLSAYAPYPPEVTREMARLYLNNLLEPAPQITP